MTFYTKSSLKGYSNDTDDILTGDIIVDPASFFVGSLIPKYTDTYNIGSSLLNWNNTFTKKLYIDDALFFFELNSNEAVINFDTASNIKYNRTNNTLKINMNGTDGLEFEEIGGTVHIKMDGHLHIDEIEEFTLNNGVIIDSDTLIKDGIIDTVDKYKIDNEDAIKWLSVRESLYLGNTGNSGAAGDHVVSSGKNSLMLNTGDSNTSAGWNSMRSNITGTKCSSYGTEALYNNLETHNDSFGYRSSFFNTTGTLNSSFGSYSMYFGTLAQKCSSFGYGSMTNCGGAGTINVSSFGYESLKNVTGGGNTGMGKSCAATLTTGSNCTFLGMDSNILSATGIESMALGYNAVVQNNYDVQLGQRTDATSGTLSFRTQDIIKENWIGSGEKTLYLDNSGNVQYGSTIGSITQITSIVTSVTLNTMVGIITTVSTTIAAEAAAVFSVTNSKVAIGDNVLINVVQYSGSYASAGLPTCQISSIGSGGFNVIILNNHSTNSLNGTLKLGFKIFKA